MAFNYGHGGYWKSPYHPIEPDVDVYGNYVVNSQYNHYYGPPGSIGSNVYQIQSSPPLIGSTQREKVSAGLYVIVCRTWYAFIKKVHI